MEIGGGRQFHVTKPSPVDGWRRRRPACRLKGFAALMGSGLAPGRSRYTTEIITDDGGLAPLARQWDALLDESPQRVYFLRAGWNQLWWQTFRPPGAELFLITVRDDGGRLAGLAPFFFRRPGTLGIPHLLELRFIGTGVFLPTGEPLHLLAPPRGEGHV